MNNHPQVRSQYNLATRTTVARFRNSFAYLGRRLGRSAPARWAILAVAAAVGGTAVRGQTVTVATFASSVPSPNGVAFDTNGNLYVADFVANNATSYISKITPGGTVTTFANGFNSPVGLAFDTNGNLYVVDANANSITKITPGGVQSGFAVGVTLNQPQGIAFDTNGNVYVANKGANTVTKIVPSGATGTTFVAAGLNQPFALAFDTSGVLYVTNFGAASVVKVSTGGVVTGTFAVGTGQPAGLAFDTSGNLYVSNLNTNAVSVVTSAGVASTFASGFSGPSGIAFDSSGRLYVANFSTNSIARVTVTYPAASGGSSPAVTANPPVITSPLTYSSPANQTFSYTIFATNSPTSYNATNVPPGCYINTYTGGITGTPTIAGVYTETISASNSGGTGYATLVVTITPLSQTISFPAPATMVANAAPFTLAATSSSGLPITYTVLSGPATVSGNTVTLTGTAGTVTIQASQGGNLAYSAAASSTISFQVTAVPTPRLVNLSARSVVTPTAPLTAGFIISGTTSKTLVLRGVGPGLSTFSLGSSPLLARPQLTLMDVNGNVLATNTGWGGGATLTSAFASVGAFPLASTSADSALIATLAPGIYTMKVTDAVADSGGLALAELYDASVDPTGVTQKLINLSSQGQVGTGNGVLVCGFIVSGTSAKPVLIRGVGPSLSAYGLTGLLADPVLNVYNSAGVLVATNNDWGTPVGVNSTQVPATAATLTSTAVQVGAFPLVAGSKDSALIVTLPPGAYTAQVSGNGGTTGTGLAEVYEIPQ